MRKLWPIPGGIHPPQNKSQSLQQGLAELPLPPQLVLPVSQHLGAPAEPTVEVGETVLKGQLIAAGKGSISANVHASTSGKIVAIEDRPLPHPSGLAGPCVVLEADGEDRWALLEECEDWREQDPAAMLRRIQAAGIAGMGGAGFPTAVKLDPQHRIRTLIINGTECEPYITADDTLMRHHSRELIEGAELLAWLLNEPDEILIGIEDNKPEAISAMQQAAAERSDERIEVVPLPTKYPSGGEKQLVQMLTGQEVPSGQLPAQLGVVCQNVGTVLAAWRAVRFGEPLIERITTITGDAFSERRNLRLRLGTPISFILEHQGYDSGLASRLVMGGPMMGFSIVDPAAPVIKTTNCLLAPSREEAPAQSPAQACIRCGLCAEACPASLLPQQLYWYARAEDDDRLQAHNLFDCIECGACSYVCPSQIPLVQYYRASKGRIRQHEIEKKHADRARRRFEFHKQRIEEEKAARAKAREEAQAKAKQRAQEKAAAKAAAGETGAADKQTADQKPAAWDSAAEARQSGKPDLLANAMAKANQNKGDERARLERKLLTAEDKLRQLEAKLADEGAVDKADALRARIRQAEVARDAIQSKLAALPARAETDEN